MKALLIAVGLGLLVGCQAAPEDVANGPDPLKALAQHIESSRYGPDYWKQAAERQPVLWRKAMAFCGRKDASEYPTCASVKMVDFLRSNSRPAARPAPFTFRTDSSPDTSHGGTNR
jgi:hypothetical protein